MSSMFLEYGNSHLHKYGETLCGDYVIVRKNGGITTTVLSDGLGSGVKAHILATLTSQILCTMLSNDMPIDQCVYTIAKTLPVDQVRQLAYATFTIFQVDEQGNAYIAQYDNPKAIILRGGKNLEYETQKSVVYDKEIYETRLKLLENDVFVMMSDGVEHAGLGKLTQNSWKHRDIVQFVEQNYYDGISPKELSTLLCETCNNLYLGRPDDDTTVVCYKLKKRSVANLMIGPPEDEKQTSKIIGEFLSLPGKHIVCGGRTTRAVAHFLGQPIKNSGSQEDPSIPPVSYIEGIDLVTEGVITLGRVSEIAGKYTSYDCYKMENKSDAASLIVKILFEEATDVNIYVGKAISPTHTDSSGNYSLSIYMKEALIKELVGCLKETGKNVKITYC